MNYEHFTNPFFIVGYLVLSVISFIILMRPVKAKKGYVTAFDLALAAGISLIPAANVLVPMIYVVVGGIMFLDKIIVVGKKD